MSGIRLFSKRLGGGPIAIRPTSKIRNGYSFQHELRALNTVP